MSSKFLPPTVTEPILKDRGFINARKYTGARLESLPDEGRLEEVRGA
jgi:hypothetical protein